MSRKKMSKEDKVISDIQAWFASMSPTKRDRETRSILKELRWTPKEIREYMILAKAARKLP